MFEDLTVYDDAVIQAVWNFPDRLFSIPEEQSDRMVFL